MTVTPEKSGRNCFPRTAKKGSGRSLLVLLPGLRGMEAEVEGGSAWFWGIDIGDGAGLADGMGPGFPAVTAALGGFFVVTGDGGVSGVKTISDEPAVQLGSAPRSAWGAGAVAATGG